MVPTTTIRERLRHRIPIIRIIHIVFAILAFICLGAAYSLHTGFDDYTTGTIFDAFCFVGVSAYILKVSTLW
jgi:hypothetical protein